MGWWERTAGWLGVALAGYGLALSPLLRVQQVEVRPWPGQPAGTLPAAVKEDLLARASFAFGEPLLAVEAGRLAQAAASLPYVARVRVRRVLPGTLAVEVQPRQAVAQLAYGSAFVEVDGQGRVLGPALHAAGSLPLLTGVLGPGEAVTAGEPGPLPVVAAAMAAAAAGPVLGERLSQVHVEGETGQLMLFLSDGSRVVWGESGEKALQEEFHRERARLLARIWPRLSQGQAFQADLSDPGRAVWSVQPGPQPSGR